MPLSLQNSVLLWSCRFLLFGAVFSACYAHTYLKTLSNLYLPARYSNGVAQYEFGAAAAEQFDVDIEDKIIYAIGSEELFVIDMTYVTNLNIITHIPVTGFEITDVEYCGGYVFVTMDNLIDKENGKVVIFNKYSRTTGQFVEYQSFTVGSLPDMIKPSPDCSKAVVAIEGEPYKKDGQLVDPEGGVGILTHHEEFHFTMLDFHSFNSRADELVAAGVRKSNPTGTLSQDLEPEYVAISDDGSTAYVSLQENNAIAVVDLDDEEIKGIYSMGYKTWSESTLDPSDDDNGISMKPWPVYGLYQPDTIIYTTFNGIGYLLTANEGDEREYNEGVSNGYIDTISGQDLAKDLSKLNLPAVVIGYLQDDRALGQTHFSTVDGINPDTGKYEKLYIFGGRSFSIIRADTMQMVYDSGNEVEADIAKYFSYIFNGDLDNNKSPHGQKDDRSSAKGPESESLAVGKIDGHMVIFVGHERPGIVSFYNVTTDITNPVLAGIWSGIPNSEETYQQLYNERRLSSVDPEDMKFISSDQSPNSKPLLIVAGSESGTVTVLEVSNNNNNDGDDRKKRSAEKLKERNPSRIMRLLTGN